MEASVMVLMGDGGLPLLILMGDGGRIFFNYWYKEYRDQNLTYVAGETRKL